MKTLQATAIPTRVLKVGEHMIDFLKESILNSCDLENSVLAITSKIVSISERRIISKNEIDKKTLVQRESDYYLGDIGYGCYLTIKHGLMIPSAGIDESNADGDYYILYPVDPFASARKIYYELSKTFGVKNFGVLLTDSHTTALRAGVTGIALAHAGFKGIQSKIGTPDLFGRALKMTRINVADALSVAAVYCMGEANESTPLALVRSSDVEFISGDIDLSKECSIPPNEDLYAPVYKNLIHS